MRAPVLHQGFAPGSVDTISPDAVVIGGGQVAWTRLAVPHMLRTASVLVFSRSDLCLLDGIRASASPRGRSPRGHLRRSVAIAVAFPRRQILTVEAVVTSTARATDVFVSSSAQYQSQLRQLSDTVRSSTAEMEASIERLSALVAAITTTENLAAYRNLAVHSRRSVAEALVMSLNNLAATLYRRGDFEQALQTTREAVEMASQLQSRDLYATALFNLAVSLRELGRFDESLEVNQRAVQLYRELMREGT